MFAKRSIFVKLFVCLLVSLFIFSLPAAAVQNNVTAAGQLNTLISKKFGADGVTLSGIDERDIKDWYIIALSGVGLLSEREKTALCNELDTYISQNNDLNQIDRLRISLSYLSLGQNNEFVKQTANGEVNDKNLMCVIYSLILCGNLDGYKDKCEILAQKIADAQINGKGWSLTGQAPIDVDVTSMALTALSPYRDGHETVIQKSLSWLSEVQNSDGTYSSYGVKNAESTAQVIIALSSLGINAMGDEAYIKENNLMDALMSFETEGGEFSHTLGGKANSRATVQSYFALCSLILYENNLPYVYSLGHTDRGGVADLILNANREQNTDINEEKNNPSIIKYILLGVIILAATILIINSFVRASSKKRAFIRAGVILLATIILSVGVMLIRKTPKDDTPPVGEPITVILSIECKNAVGKTDNEYIGDGVIAEQVTLTVPDGCSVLYALNLYCEQNNIHIDAGGGYISGIAHLYERDCSSESGWMYFVNGISPSESVEDYALSDGDKIEIRYTCNMGADLK